MLCKLLQEFIAVLKDITILEWVVIATIFIVMFGLLRFATYVDDSKVHML